MQSNTISARVSRRSEGKTLEHVSWLCLSFCFCLLQIVSQRKLTKALLKQGNTAGKSSITVWRSFWSQLNTAPHTPHKHSHTHRHACACQSHTRHLLNLDTLKIINLMMLPVQSVLFLISISFSVTSLFCLSACHSLSLSLALCLTPLLRYFLSPCVKVTAEELSGNDDYVELSFSARKLDDKVCATVCALGKCACVFVCVCVLGVASQTWDKLIFQAIKLCVRCQADVCTYVGGGRGSWRWSNSHSIHRSTVWHYRRPPEKGGHPPANPSYLTYPTPLHPTYR